MSRCPICKQEWDDGQHTRCGEIKMELKDPVTGEAVKLDDTSKNVSGGLNEPKLVDGNRVDTRIHGAGGDITGAPLEGNVRENAGVPPGEGTLNVDRLVRESNKADFVPDAGPLAGGILLSDAQREAQETLVGGAGRLSEANKELKEHIETKLEDKSPESVKKDLHEELSHPGSERENEELNPSRTVQRADGTITTADRLNETAHYIHGARVMMTDEQKLKFDALTEAMNAAQGGLGVSDIPLDDDYWQRKKELDAFVARLKR